MIVSLEDLFLRGEFGALRAGFSPVALEAVFGPPEAVGGGSRRRPPAIWKYGDVEFHFSMPERTLSMVFLDRFTAREGYPQGWGGLQLEPWIVREALPLAEFLRALSDHGIEHTVCPEPRLNQEIVALTSGVRVSFTTRPEPYGPPAGLTALALRWDDPA